MRWFWVRLNNWFNRSVDTTQNEEKVQKITWTKASRPFNEMSKDEQRAFIEKMAKNTHKNLPKQSN
jgi:hypothetical protein